MLTDALLTASRALVAVAARSLAAVDDDVTLPQYRALVVLAVAGPSTSAIWQTHSVFIHRPPPGCAIGSRPSGSCVGRSLARAVARRPSH